jgi:cell division protein FtsB
LAETLRARREYAKAAAELTALTARNAALRADMHRLVSDPSAIEAVARQDLGLVRPGEILVVIKDIK